jgi:hypothetical protein
MGSAVRPVSSASQPVPGTPSDFNTTTNGARARNLVFFGLCLICDVVHGPDEQCPSLYSKVKIRLALDGLKMSALKSKGPTDAIAMKRAVLLDHLRFIEMGRA